VNLRLLAGKSRFAQFAKFCLVGASGVLVDMAVLHCLARELGWNVNLSKLCSAEAAMLSNFVWNEIWTFRGAAVEASGAWRLIIRLLKFQAICGAGIGLAIVLLSLFYRCLGINLYASNFLAILLVTLWNFWMNALFNWGGRHKGSGERLVGEGP
jgi:dolichol-phosphate mannosyltransferase